jgi:hypothetical protein
VHARVLRAAATRALHCDREAVVASSQSFAEYGDAFQEKNVYNLFVAF